MTAEGGRAVPLAKIIADHRATLARVVIASNIAAISLLCLAHGLYYTVLRPPGTTPTPALQAFAELPVLKHVFGDSVIPLLGGLWSLSALLGLISLFWKKIEPWFWFSVLGIFGLWGGLYVGGAIVLNTRAWISGVLYLLVGVLLAGIWFLAGLVRDYLHYVQVSEGDAHPTHAYQTLAERQDPEGSEDPEESA